MGALRYAAKGGGLELCAGKVGGWSAVSPPSLGKNAENAGKSCAALKVAGVNTGSGLYWLDVDDPALVFCDMSGDGVAVGDGSTKALSAPSCFEVQQYYFAVTKKFKKFWIEGATMACAIQGGIILSEGDGKTAGTASASCQNILDVFGGLKNKDERFLKGSGKSVCFVSEDGKTASSFPPIACGNEKDPDEYRLPRSCYEILQKCTGAKDGKWWIQAQGYNKIEVTCDMKTKSANDGQSGWMRLYTADLKAFSKASCKSNAGCSFNWECDSFFSYPNSNDYEVWNNFDVQFPWTEVRGTLDYSPQCGGHNNGCSPNGAHPDNGWYGFKSDATYTNLGAGGEGGGNKAWHRWGKPGHVIQGGPELGWDGEYNSKVMTTTAVEESGLKKGSILRISSSSESGAPPCERFMIKTRLWVR